jgi:hypothetical protein
VAAPRNDLKERSRRVAGFGLHNDEVEVASFAEGRIGYREWALGSGRLYDIHSLDDRYDHDVDELMA